MNLVLLGVGLVLAVLAVRAAWHARPAMSVEQARAALAAGTAVLIDVREPPEWSSGVAQPAALLPFSDLRGPRRTWTPFLQKNRGQQLILYCASGMRSGSAAGLLRREGLEAVNLGGFHRWAGAGLPVRRP